MRNKQTLPRTVLLHQGQAGHGLGLAMVYGVMERHEGKIEIASELGKGSTFRLIFPVRKATHQGVGAEEDTSTTSPLRILTLTTNRFCGICLRRCWGATATRSK